MEKGRLGRVKGMPDPSARLAEPTMLPRHLILKNVEAAENFDSDSLASLAARKHRKVSPNLPLAFHDMVVG